MRWRCDEGWDGDVMRDEVGCDEGWDEDMMKDGMRDRMRM